MRSLLLALPLVLSACPPSTTPSSIPGHPRPAAPVFSPVAPVPPLAPEPPRSPAWRPTHFTRATEGCSQVFACDLGACVPPPGCHVEPVSDATTQGTCAANSGLLIDCTRCLALPPSIECACHYACP